MNAPSGYPPLNWVGTLSFIAGIAVAALIVAIWLHNRR